MFHGRFHDCGLGRWEGIERQSGAHTLAESRVGGGIGAAVSRSTAPCSDEHIGVRSA